MKNVKGNVYWEAFKLAEDKNKFVVDLAKDFEKLLDAEEPTYLTDEDFNYPRLIDTVTLDEEESAIVLANENDIVYEDTLVCFQTILNGPMMLLEEESLDEFFRLVFEVSIHEFIRAVEGEVTPIEHNGVKAVYYNETRDDGIPFTGVLFS